MILEAFLRGAIVFVIAGVLSLLLVRRSAALRHHVWASAIFIQLALLAFIPTLPPISLPVVPEITAFVAEPLASRAQPEAAAGRVPSPEAPAAAPPETRPDIAISLWHVWLLGAGLILVRYLIGTLLMMRLAHKSRRVDDGEWLTLAQRIATELNITRPVTLVWGSKLAVPITWGVLYPMILLPESARDWPAERRRFVLVHEMAHVRRFDALTQLVAQITLAVFWFSPFLWLAEWRLRVEREHACDDVVINHGTEPTLYADELLQMVRALVARKTARPAFAALAMARRSEFEGRMLAILDPVRRRSAAEIGSALAFIALSLAIAAPLAALDPFAAKVTVATQPIEARPADIVTMTGPDSVYTCTLTDLKQPGSNQTNAMVMVHAHTADDPAKSYTEVKITEDERCVVGLVRQGAVVRLQETTRSSVRIADFLTTGVTYTLNGRTAAPDDRWVERWRPVILQKVEEQQREKETRKRPPETRKDTARTDALEDAFASIESDGDLHNALKAQLHTADKRRLIWMMRTAAKMTSGFELSGFLIEASPFVLTRKDNQLEAAWFDTVRLLTSSYEHKNALMAAIGQAHDNKRLQDRIARSAALMSSSTDKAAVLTALAAIR